MQTLKPLRSLIIVLGLVTCAASASAVTLYDPASGLPAAQGWASLVQGAAGTQSVSAGRYLLDTTGVGASTTHGNGRVSGTTLDTVAGFTLAWSLRVAAENHSSANRAGFSMVVIGSDPTHSLELAFWDSSVWAYHYDAADADRFVHGTGALLDTGSSFRDYLLTVQGNSYSLASGSTVLFSGALENYTAQGLPYTVPNFLFFGDNTSRAASSVEVGSIVLTPIPEPASAVLMALGLGAVAVRARRRGLALAAI